MKRKKILGSFIICIITLFLIINANVVQANNEESDYIYLSDLDYITTDNWSYNGWAGHVLQKDKNQDGGMIRLRLDGTIRSFLKGLGIHANGQVTYDISEYSGKYTRFIAKLGVDASKTSVSNLWIRISSSNDGQNWTELHKTAPILYNSNAVEVDLSIENAKYLRIYVDSNGSNASDHADIADAKLVTADYDDSKSEYTGVRSLAYYDEILSANELDYNMENNYRLILEREFCRKVGYDIIQAYAGLANTRETIEWILSTNENLEQVIEVGELANGATFINVLDNLYHTYKSDLATEDGYVYKKMMIGLAAAYTTDRFASPLTFGHQYASYDYIERFRLMKKLYDEDLLTYKNQFKNYHVELMRSVMQDSARMDEVLWMNYYTRSKNSNSSVYAYVNHTGNSVSYAHLLDGNLVKEQYDAKYHLTEYGVPYGDNIYRIWMVIARGGICWNQSRVFQSLFRNVGRPSIGSYQPQHESAFFYCETADGLGYWGLANNIFGWGKTGTSWYGGNRTRTLFNWSNKSFTHHGIYANSFGNSGGYIILAQDNLNRYQDYKQSLYYNLLANSYTDSDKKIEAYDKALESSEINLDSFDYKINVYKTAGNKTSDDWYELAKDVIDSFTFYPMAMDDLIIVIKPYLNGAHLVDIEQKEYAALQRAKVATASESFQYGAISQIAGVLLGQKNPKFATFSFDGDNAGKIIINSSYATYDLAWRYSLDGGKTKSNAITEKSFQLSAEELATISVENDIKLYIDGLVGNDPAYTIDIINGSLPTLIFANDLENRLIAAGNAGEWRNNETEPWKKYTNETPDFTGDKTIEFRVGYTGVCVPTDSITFTFTEDTDTNVRKYIKVSRLTVADFSTEATGSGQNGNVINAIDGNYNTRWHSNWNGNDANKYIVVKLDEPIVLSALDYVPADGLNGRIFKADILGSLDGENFTEIATVDWANDTTVKTIDFADLHRVQYIKIVGKSTRGNFITASSFNFYENTTVKVVGEFSFDGELAGKIRLYNDYANNNWKYSLDGGATWKDASSSEHQLTNTEIAQINEDNDIKIRIDALGINSVINIKKGIAPAPGFLNDLENTPLGLTNIDKLEWRYEEDKNWTSYSEAEPYATGNRKLFVRTKAFGIFTPSDPNEYVFTEDNQPATEKYVRISNLSIAGYSSQSKDSTRPFYAPNVIDGNPNTIWHTDFAVDVRTQEIKPFITIKLNQGKYISAVEYDQKKNKPANNYEDIKNVIVYVSEDGANFTEAGRLENCTQYEGIKKIAFAESVYAQYIKVEFETYNIFASASTINLYEDTTKLDKIAPTAEIHYSTTEPTNQDVVATLVNASKEITITNNGGKNTHTFTGNNSFTFEYIDNDGNTGSTTATVTWINKKAPEATITYSTDQATNEDVVATIDFEEGAASITNNGGKYTHTFTENGKFVFEYIDELGNVGSATAEVAWIDKRVPVATVKYSITELTNQNVVAKVTFDEDNVIITNNGGSNMYTFNDNDEFVFNYVDPVGNTGTATAKVDWIDRKVPTATLDYDITTATGQDVVVTISFDEENVTIINNSGSYTYTFTENKEFTFEFVDQAGNRGKATAKVDWIDKSLPIATFEYDIINPTKNNVTVNVSFNRENITITNNGGKYTHTFTENGDFTFVFVDEDGNESVAVAKVNWIDKDAPIAKLEYDKYDDRAIVRVVDANEEIFYAVGNGIYEFTKNGTYEIKFSDAAGNTTTLVAVVDWIREASNNPDDNKEDNSNNTNINTNTNTNTNTNANTNTNINTNTNTNTSTNTNTNTNRKGVNSNINNSTTTQNSKTSDLDDDSNNGVDNNNYERPELKLKNVKIKGSKSDLEKVVSVMSESFVLSETLRDKLGGSIETIEVMLFDENGRISIKAYESLKVAFTIESDKKVAKLYTIKNDKLVEIDYANVSKNEIEADLVENGKYVIEYEENKEDSKYENSNNSTTENASTENTSSNATVYVIATCTAVLTIGGTSVVIYKKKIK